MFIKYSLFIISYQRIFCGHLKSYCTPNNLLANEDYDLFGPLSYADYLFLIQPRVSDVRFPGYRLAFENERSYRDLLL